MVFVLVHFGVYLLQQISYLFRDSGIMTMILIMSMMESSNALKTLHSTLQNACRVVDTFSGDTPVGILHFPMKISMKLLYYYFRSQNP